MSGLPRRLVSTGSGYVVSYLNDMDQEVVRFEIEDVDADRWGLNATVVVRSRIEGARTLDGRFVTMARVQMLSPQSKSMLARTMEQRIRPPAGAAAMSFDLMVDEAFHDVIEASKAPLLVQDLSLVTPAPTPRFLVPGIVQEHETTILYAAGGTGKSYLCLALAAAIQLGGRFLGRECQQRNVLYLDWESRDESMARRLMLVSKGMGMQSIAPIKYINFDDTFRRHQSGIAMAVAEHDIGVVILDSVSMATSGGSGGVTNDAIDFMRGLRALKVTCLLIDHVSSEDVKRGKPVNKAMGSVAKGNQARAAYELRDTTDPMPGSTQHVTLRHTKANDTRKQGDLQMFVEWIGEGDEVDRVMFREDVGWVEPEVQPLDIRIVDLLATGPASHRQLVEMLGDVSELDVRRVIKDLTMDRMVVVDSQTGMTRLASKEAPTHEQPALDLGD